MQNGVCRDCNDTGCQRKIRKRNGENTKCGKKIEIGRLTLCQLCNTARYCADCVQRTGTPSFKRDGETQRQCPSCSKCQVDGCSKNWVRQCKFDGPGCTAPRCCGRHLKDCRKEVAESTAELSRSDNDIVCTECAELRNKYEVGDQVSVCPNSGLNRWYEGTVKGKTKRGGREEYDVEYKDSKLEVQRVSFPTRSQHIRQYDGGDFVEVWFRSEQHDRDWYLCQVDEVTIHTNGKEVYTFRPCNEKFASFKLSYPKGKAIIRPAWDVNMWSKGEWYRCKIIGTKFIGIGEPGRDNGDEYYDTNIIYTLKSQKEVNGTYEHQVRGGTTYIDTIRGHYVSHIDQYKAYQICVRAKPAYRERRRLANRHYSDSPVLLRLLEEIREANRRHQARERARQRERR